MKNGKLNKDEIIPAEDILKDELENICGGAEDALHICLKGCVTGDKKGKEDDQSPKDE